MTVALLPLGSCVSRVFDPYVCYWSTETTDSVLQVFNVAPVRNSGSAIGNRRWQQASRKDVRRTGTGGRCLGSLINIEMRRLKPRCWQAPPRYNRKQPLSDLADARW
ncbi:hypothetical protein ALP10_200086 [Pseudomonas syringae pv. helianthi]|uniref:Uncharacterized protein n=1 Tax=Pseudomonas syringae pv. helianthi TaxID=251654 RepID=A0A3M6CN70_9PSED|nr:hypothetical protein ALP10_200086 [Pseudomonas syringae pv. helianthi]